jgi:hypothetical protein
MVDNVSKGVEDVTRMLLINKEYAFIAGFYESNIANIIRDYVPEDKQESLLLSMFTDAGRIVTNDVFKRLSA